MRTKHEKAILAGTILAFVIFIVAVSVIVYVMQHFIRKYW